MQLTRAAVFGRQEWFVISARHVPGKANSVADALSRSKPSDEFLSSVKLHLESNRLPPELVDWIDDPQWTSAGLEEVAAELLDKEGLASSTRRSYASGQRAFLSFCAVLRLGARLSRRARMSCVCLSHG